MCGIVYTYFCVYVLCVLTQRFQDAKQRSFYPILINVFVHSSSLSILMFNVEFAEETLDIT